MSDIQSAYEAVYHDTSGDGGDGCYADPRVEQAYEQGYQDMHSGTTDRYTAVPIDFSQPGAIYPPQDTMGPATPGQYPTPSENGDGEMPHGPYGPYGDGEWVYQDGRWVKGTWTPYPEGDDFEAD